MKNTTLSLIDDYDEQSEMTTEEVLMNEADILEGLLKAAGGFDDADNYQKIQIKRKGKLMFEFRVRPVTEEESIVCMRRSTPSAKGRKIKPETNWAKYRSYLIYTATVDEDRAKVWDNKAAHEKLGILQGVDMVDKVLFAGEKSRVIEIIDEISDNGAYDEEVAGNF
ncbi:MAG: hypothetical protein FWH05_08785 [Oscillospiraceae bacterium]|nr:hypothetical protein [Oscillospiraceae bacterium]